MLAAIIKAVMGEEAAEVEAASGVTVAEDTAAIAVVITALEAVVMEVIKKSTLWDIFINFSFLGGRDRGDYGGKRDLDRRDSYG